MSETDTSDGAQGTPEQNASLDGADMRSDHPANIQDDNLQTPEETMAGEENDEEFQDALDEAGTGIDSFSSTAASQPDSVCSLMTVRAS